MNKHINIKSVTKLTDFKWLNLFDVEFTSDDKVHHWIFASRKEIPVLGSTPIKADAVVIIPFLKEGRKRKLVTTREFRLPLGDWEYGFPAGLCGENETIESVAKRELKEETGLKLTKVLYVGPASISSAGLSDESIVYVVCECTGEPNNTGNEEVENISVEILDLDGVRKLRQSDKKTSAKALPFLLFFDGINKIAWPRHLRERADAHELPLPPVDREMIAKSKEEIEKGDVMLIEDLIQMVKNEGI